jgi:F-type H+-transporting ATPase subunit gamma
MMASVGRSAGSIDSPLLTARDEINTIATIVISSDRGLAGAYNSNVIRTAERDLQAHGKQTHLFLTGKKALSYFRFRGYDVSDAWQGFSERPSIGDARKVAVAASTAYLDHRVDEVRLVYTRYESALTQRPLVVKLLPMPKEEFEGDTEQGGAGASYLFEPSPEEILDLLLPRYVEGTILQAMLEGAASELAARRRAMKAATDNAEELIDNLTRVYNQARQAEITTEIMEVVGGAEALSGQK